VPLNQLHLIAFRNNDRGQFEGAAAFLISLSDDEVVLHISEHFTDDNQ